MIQNAPDPVGQLFDIGRCRGKRHQADLIRREHDRFLPDRAALGVIQIMDLVKNDPGSIFEADRILKELVAVDLRGHDDDGRVRIQGDVAGQKSDLIGVADRKIAVLLVGERLDGGGVDHPLTPGDRFFDRVFSDGGLAGTGGSGDQDGSLRVDRGDGF